MDKIKILKFYRSDQKSAIVHRFNCYIRVLDGENKESFFRELSQAIKYLLNEGYYIDLNM
jgi:hypothetical protein